MCHEKNLWLENIENSRNLFPGLFFSLQTGNCWQWCFSDQTMFYFDDRSISSIDTRLSMDGLDCIYKRIEIFFLFHWYKISQFDQLVFQIVCYPSGFSSGWNTNKRSVCEINIFLHLPPTHFLLFKYRDLLLEDGKESLINCRCKSGYSSTSTVYFISLHIFFVINYFE